MIGESRVSMRKVNAMDPASRSKIIKNLSTERFFKTNAQLLHNFSDRHFVKNTFPTSENVYSDGDMDRVHSLWTPKNKFETFLELKKRDPPSLVKSLVNNSNILGKQIGVNENKNKNMALIKPIPNPLEVIKDDEGIIRPIPSTRKKLVNDAGVPANITPIYDPVEFPDEIPYIPHIIPKDDIPSSFRRFNGDLRVDDVDRFPPPPLSPSLNLPEVPTHIPEHTPSFEVEDGETIARRKEDKNYRKILRKLKTAPAPPNQSPYVSDEEEESVDIKKKEEEDYYTPTAENEDMSWDEAENYVDSSSTNNFVEDAGDILKMIEHLTGVVEEKLNDVFKNSLIRGQIQNFLLYLVNRRRDVLVDNRMGRNYSQIYTYDGVGNLRDSGESILFLIFNMLDQTKRQIKPLDELRGGVVFDDYDKTFSTYYNGIANMNKSDYYETDYLPHLKLLVQQFNDSRDKDYFQAIVFRSYKDPSAEAYRDSRKVNGPLKFFMDELNSFNQQVDDQFRLRVGVKETPQLINLINLLKDIYEDNLYSARFLYDFFFNRIFKETAEGRSDVNRRVSYRDSLMEMIEDFDIGGVSARRVINQITKTYDRGSMHSILAHEDIMVIADCFINAFYKHLICIPFGVQVPVELIKIIDDYKYLYDSFKSQWENNYNDMSTVSKTMARYFALNFLFIFYTYGVSVINGDMLNEDVYEQRRETLNDMTLSEYMSAVMKNMNQSIAEFDFDREQSFFSSLDGFRTKLGGLYMEKVFTKRPSSPIIITEDDEQPYMTLYESRERGREDRMVREQQRLDDLRQEEYEKERENREKGRMVERERERAEARALSNAMFEEKRRLHEIAVENERIRIERLDAEREEIMRRNVEEQIKSLEDQERQWKAVNENISSLERSKDLMSEEEEEQDLEWEYEHITDDEDDDEEKVDGDTDPYYGLANLQEIDPPPFRKGGVKRSARRPLRSLHVKKITRREEEEDAASYMSDISDEDENAQFISDLSSGEEDLSVRRRKPKRKSRARKVKLIPIGRKRTADTDLTLLRPSDKRRDTVQGRAIRKRGAFRPIQQLPSQPSFVRADEDISKRFMSDVSSDEDGLTSLEEDDDNPRLKQLKTQMNTYSEAFLTDDDEIESLDGISDGDEW